MPVRLKNPNAGFPAGGFPFSDPHTAKRFDDPFVDVNHLVKQIIDHRVANPRIYPPTDTIKFDPVAVTQEVIVQLCADKPQLCEDDARPGQPYPAPPEPAQHPPRPGGKACIRCQGNDFEPVYCRTCGGGKLTGWKCKSCGMEQ